MTQIQAGSDTAAVEPGIAAVKRAITAFAAGRPVLVADSMDRENEVDAIVAAAGADARVIGWMVRHTSGYLCAPMPAERADVLALPAMVTDNQDPKRTAYTVACDAANGITTGISAADRARTLRVLANQESTPQDLIRPGHVLPLRARPGGVRERAGHTEAAVELCQLAGIAPVAAIGELVMDDGSMMRVRQAHPFAVEHGLELISIADLIVYLNQLDAASGSSNEDANPRSLTPAERATQAVVEAETDSVAGTVAAAGRVTRVTEAKLPTKFGDFRVLAYRDKLTGVTHLAILSTVEQDPAAPALVRIHSECLTGEALGSLRCDCGPQLQTALTKIAQHGGAVIYLRGHEGRGIGLGEKIRAYALQDQGLDTAAANEHLGWPVDARDYGAAAAILADLQFNTITLLTNNPDKAQLDPRLVTISGVQPLEVGFDPHNIAYLQTKSELGHTFHKLDEYVRSLGA